MASSRTTDEKQNLKQNLADFIKSVHGNLRQEVYEGMEASCYKAIKIVYVFKIAYLEIQFSITQIYLNGGN